MGSRLCNQSKFTFFLSHMKRLTKLKLNQLVIGSVFPPSHLGKVNFGSGRPMQASCWIYLQKRHSYFFLRRRRVRHILPSTFFYLNDDDELARINKPKVSLQASKIHSHDASFCIHGINWGNVITEIFVFNTVLGLVLTREESSQCLLQLDFFKEHFCI